MSHAGQLPLQFYATAPYPCSYLPERMARSQVATPGYLVDTEVYSQLMDRGFRRSGLFTYRPHCHHCNACQTLRIPVKEFKPNRSQRRTWKNHQYFSAQILRPIALAEHFALYQRYLAKRHSDGGMDHDSLQDYQQFLLTSRVDTRLIEFRDPTTKTLLMVSVVDILVQGISAVYTFYDADQSSGYGTYSILWLMELARSMQLDYLYLGYWIGDSPKMAYKSKFLPHEILVNGDWQRVIEAK